MASDARTIVRGVVVAVVVAGAIVFAVQGGEFGTLDLLREGREIRCSAS
jgi:hypothetical protein